MEKYTEVKEKLDSLIAFLRDALPNVGLDDSPVLYYISAALKIWGSNLLYSPDYGTLLSCCGFNCTIEQVVTAMSCCGDEERRLMVPHFFEQLVERDRQTGGTLAQSCIERLNSLLVATAMINGDFTVEEANSLSGIIEGLTRYALSEGVAMDGTLDNRAKITERNEDSYLKNDALIRTAREQALRKKENSDLQNDALMRAAREQAVHEKENSGLQNNVLSKPAGEQTLRKKNEQQTDPSADIVLPVTINVNLTSSDSSGSQSSSIQAEQPEDASVTTGLPPERDGETLESLLAELDDLVGLKGVKQDVHSLMNFIKVTKIREQRGMRVPTISYHLVFTGNPGTGKTTVARLVARLYYHMGILPQGQLVETDRSSLVAGYLGQTAIKTQKVIQQAMGGVLFIDEAYSLAGETDDSYGREAVETILKAMEDHRDELVVIVAGYTELMHKFIESNPGLSSRFSKYFEFLDYSGEELLSIFESFCDKNGYVLDEDASSMLKAHFETLFEVRDEHFGNARTARNIFEKAINAQADRIAFLPDLSDSALERITAADITAAIGGSAR